MKKKFVPDHLCVVDAEKDFVGVIGAASAVPECYANLGAYLAALAQARENGDVDQLRELSRRRWTAIQAVRAHGPSGVAEVDSAFQAMEAAAEEAGAAKRRR
jgi:predicted ArsR family transcriptional regulator